MISGVIQGVRFRTLGDVLSIAKLRVGSEAYQLSGVAQSLDDYYSGRGEAAGLWLGAGAERLGLSGEVAADDLRAVLAGIAPGSGGFTPDGATIRPHPKRVPGFDLTFKAAKSVSVLYAVSDDPRVQGAIIEAGQVAVRDTIAWLEREAIRIRRGTGNEAWLNDLAARDPEAAAAARIRSLPGRGVVAATFRHRTSRAGDPLLHWHTLVANLVEGSDGRWSAFVHPDLYRAVRAAGEVFQTVMRAELTERLGLEWRPGRHVPEVAGVPQALCELFSKRSAEIDAWLAATGTPDDPAGRQEAVLATRRNKPELEDERFDIAWKLEATDAGWGPEQAETLIASATARHVPIVEEVWRLPRETRDRDDQVTVVDWVVDPEEWIGVVARDLTESDATFTRPELVQAVAARIGEGATVATIDRTVARVLASPQVVPVADERGPRWTTTEILDVERRFLSVAADTRRQRPAVPARQVEAVIGAVPTLGDDQAAAVRTLASSRDAVSVLVGPAGTGKTFTLDVVRRVFESVGQDVVGVAPSARGAHELQSGAAIQSSTIHRLVGSWSRGYERPTQRTVLVVDEAGMAGTRDLEQVVSGIVAAGGRVVLVGDHHQLPEVVAGGGFAALAADPTATVAQLSVNRRQRHGWERDALVELRDGAVPAAVAAYRTNQRLVVADDRAAMVDVAVGRWLAAHRQGRIPVLLAGTNETVTALNTAVRGELLQLGVLGPTVDPAGRLAVGERVMTRSNDYQAVTVDGATTHVLNGHTGTLVGTTEGGLVVRMDHDDSHVVLDADYLAGGGLTYAYASTAHRAQGGTWDLAITVGLDGLYREAAYLVMSRGRESNWMVLTAPEVEILDAELARHDSPLLLPGEEPDTANEELLARWSASRAKQLALTRDPWADAINHAATAIPLTNLESWGAYAAAVEDQGSRLIGGDPARLAARLDRIEHTARHASIGQRVKALDRRNIGTITGLDDTAGAVEVTFVAVDGRTATRNLSWGDVEILRPNHGPRTLTDTAQATLGALIGTGRQQIERWHAHLADHGVQPGDRHVYQHAARLAVDRAAALHAATQPDWLTALVGSRPDQPAPVQVWDDTIREIAAHRLRHGIDDPAVGSGPDATDAAEQAVWNTTAPTVAEARLWLDTHTTRPALNLSRIRSAAELYARHAELDALFADAPPDCRGLIERLHHGGQLPTVDTAELLRDALATQGERRRWILHHWPHIVEHTQITQTLEHGLADADPRPLVAALAESTQPVLAAAAQEPEHWLLTLTAQLVPAHTTSIPPAVEALLADIADYRQRWHITHHTPLGDAATDTVQASERTLLTFAVDAAAPAPDLTDDLDTQPPGRLFDVDALGR